MATIEFKNIQKRFGALAAVQDFNLAIGQGEFIALVGPSGCGKTTSLRMLAGLEMPDAGSITLDGQDITQLAPKLRNLAMVFQNYALYPHMSVGDNIGYALRMRGMRKADIAREIASAAAMLGLDGLLDRKPHQLSGGQRQRVAVCRAIVRHPAAFLFDEPLSNLDAKLRTTARTEIRSLQQRLGITAVYVTHDQVEAMTMADRIVVMKDGRIQQIGTPLEVYETPANVFVAGFIGSPAMNLLPAYRDTSGNLAAFGLRVDASASARAGATATVGVRPEDIRIQRGDCAHPLEVSARLQHVEHLGAETLLHLDLQGNPVQARIPQRYQHTPDSNVSLFIDPSRLHVFRSETGQRLAA
ncbi:MAG TPA: sn-glycerol-3-phosphate ABC transporter ATP-binding protein UgpC [Ramlibacter sp.]|nr:sn-glycerol-3-phosphate ABC transporter ATP-binding protein UgpC [Ramlibacter sp.]